MNKKEKFFDTNHLLDEVLKTEPEFKLSDDFADRVAVKAGNSFVWQQYWKEFLVYLAAILGIVGVVVGLFFISFGLKLDLAISYLLSNISLVVSLFILGLFILFADRVLLPYFMYRKSKEIV